MDLFHMDPFGLQILLACVPRFPIGANEESSTEIPLRTLGIGIGAVGPVFVLLNAANRRLRSKVT